MKEYFLHNIIIDIKRNELSKDQLFKLKMIYEFVITEFEPEKVDKLNDIKNLPIVTDFDIIFLISKEKD